MRFARSIAAAAALALLSLLPVALTSSAAEADTFTGTTANRDVSAAARRTVTINFGGGSGSFRLTGNVSPKGGDKTVKLMRANKKRGNYSVFRRNRTDGSGHYAFKGLQRTGWYLARVPNSKGFKTSTSGKVHVTRA